jgi:hypothetical protein
MKNWGRLNWALATAAVTVAASELAAGIWMYYMSNTALRLQAVTMGILGAGAAFGLALSAHVCPHHLPWGSP